jgi:hypothetical protein
VESGEGNPRGFEKETRREHIDKHAGKFQVTIVADGT